MKGKCTHTRTARANQQSDYFIFACGREWSQIEDTIRKGYGECAEWLTRAGLNIEPDKSELIFFRKRGEKSNPPPYTHGPQPTCESRVLEPLPTQASLVATLGYQTCSQCTFISHSGLLMLLPLPRISISRVFVTPDQLEQFDPALKISEGRFVDANSRYSLWPLKNPARTTV